MNLVLGIDTGGTCTDAVLYDMESQHVAASGKTLTTKDDLSKGIGAVLDQLPQDLLAQANCLSLSTTLATNACVEDKGGRAKLIFIGAERQIVESTGGKYGLPPAEEIFFLDAVIHGDGSVEQEPNWDRFLTDAAPFLRNADAVAIVAYQGIHNPILEQQAKALLLQHFGLNAVCGHELFWTLNYIKRGGSTLLNARLIPVIASFLTAVRKTLKTRGLCLPIVIVRSDGTLMSEAFSQERPVETILCGPAASVLGGMKLAGRQDGIVVDMGGTTTDLAIVRNGRPVMGTDGVSIGKWNTCVDSLYVHTFGLGGDSVVRLGKDGGITVGPQRVIPFCVAASRWESVVPALAELVETGRTSGQPLHEFFYLLRDVSEDVFYTGEEREACRLLGRGPMRLDRLAEAVGCDHYTFRTDRLEREGIVMRCGFTPTDAMHLLGDFRQYDRHASELGARYLANCLSVTPEKLCDMVYEFVKKTLYTHLVQALLENGNPIYKKGELDVPVKAIVDAGWEHRHDPDPVFHFYPRTSLPLIGIGASTHLFLPDVAEALGTDYVIPDHAAVANALGAAVSNISAVVSAEVRPEEGGFWIHTPRQRLFEEDQEEAFHMAERFVMEEARQEAIRRGVRGEITVSCSRQPITAMIGAEAHWKEVCLATIVSATATGSAGF